MADCTCPEPRGTSWSLSCELHGQSRIRKLESRLATAEGRIEMMHGTLGRLVEEWAKTSALWDAIHADTRKRVTRLERARVKKGKVRR